jgi:hypothetical protein
MVFWNDRGQLSPLCFKIWVRGMADGPIITVLRKECCNIIIETDTSYRRMFSNFTYSCYWKAQRRAISTSNALFRALHIKYRQLALIELFGNWCQT